MSLQKIFSSSFAKLSLRVYQMYFGKEVQKTQKKEDTDREKREGMEVREDEERTNT